MTTGTKTGKGSTVTLDDVDLHLAEASGLYVGWWNEAMQIWMGLPTVVDAEAGTVTFETSHLTVFGWFASKLGYERKQMGQFEIVWDAEILTPPADKTDAAAWEGKILYASEGDAARLYPDEAWATDAGIPPFVRDTAAYLNHSLKLYKAAGFKVPKGTITVTLGGSDARNKALDMIHIGENNTGAAQLKGACAHELFHAVQNEYLWDLGGMMFLNWWCESTAEYASQLVWAPARPGRTVPPKYFSERLDSTNYEHEYESAYFISDLVGSGSQAERFKRFHALWTGTLAQHGATDATDMLYPLSVHLMSDRDDLKTRFNEHVYRMCLMPGSPMAGTDGALSPDSPASGMAERWATLAPDDEETSPMTMTLKGGHRAKVWGVRVRTVKSGESRPVELELTGELSGYIMATVHVLPGGKRSDRALAPHGRFYAANRKVKLSVTQDDEVYVVVVNHGSGSKDFTLTVREGEASLLDVLHQMNMALFSVRTEGGYEGLSCENLTWSGTSFQGETTSSMTDGMGDVVVDTDRVSGQVSADGMGVVTATFYSGLMQNDASGAPTSGMETEVTVVDVPIDPDVLKREISLDMRQLNYARTDLVSATTFPRFVTKWTDKNGTTETPMGPGFDGGSVTVYFGRK